MLLAVYLPSYEGMINEMAVQLLILGAIAVILYFSLVSVSGRVLPFIVILAGATLGTIVSAPFHFSDFFRKLANGEISSALDVQPWSVRLEYYEMVGFFELGHFGYAAGIGMVASAILAATVCYIVKRVRHREQQNKMVATPD